MAKHDVTLTAQPVPGPVAGGAGVVPLIAPQGSAFVPAEDVLLIAVALPAMSAAQRAAAIGFAVEDRIGQPLDLVHVVAGPPGVVPGTWLVAVVGHEVMAAHPGSGALVPDVMALPVPEAGQWSVWAQGGRVLARLPDGSGIGVNEAMLPVIWAQGGAPEVVLYGGDLPSGVTVAVRAALPDAGPPLFDLRSGRHARRRAGLPRGVPALAAVLGLAALGHLGLMAADVAGLARIAAQREGALRGALTAAGAAPGDDLDAALGAALAARAPVETGGPLALMARAFAAIGPQAGQVQVADLRYGRADASLALRLEAPDLGTLQALEAAFAAGGMVVAAGAATTADGAAEVQMTLRGAGP